MTKDKDFFEPLWTKNFIITTLVTFLLFFGFQMLLPILPIFAKSIGADESTIGMVTGIFVVSAISIRPITGIMLDRIGRKSIFLIGLIIFIISVLSYNFISSLAIILLFRFIHGFGWGMANTASNTIASDIIPKTRFGEGMGYFGLSASLSMALGPAIGLFLIENFDFKAVFYLAGLLAIVSFIMSFSIEYKEGEKEKTKDKLVLFEKSSITPSIIMFFLTITYGTVVSFISIYAPEKGIENIGLFFTVYAVSILLTRPIFGKIIDKFGFDYLMIPGIILVIISMVALSFAKTLAVFILIGLIYGIGFGACQACLQTMAVIDAPPDNRGAANATFFTGFDSGIGIGSIIYGYLASNLGYSRMYLLAAIPAGMAFIVYFLIGRKK